MQANGMLEKRICIHLQETPKLASRCERPSLEEIIEYQRQDPYFTNLKKKEH